MLRGKTGTLGAAALVATTLTGMGWVGTQLESPGYWLWYDLGVMLLGPGGVIATIAAILFSPQGVHGIEQYDWMILPATWFFYFLLTVWILFRLIQMLTKRQIP